MSFSSGCDSKRDMFTLFCIIEAFIIVVVDLCEFAEMAVKVTLTLI